MKETQHYFININFLAADTGYSCNTYGAGSYNQDQCATNTGTDTNQGTNEGTNNTQQTTGTGTSGGNLASTGTNMAIGVGGGLALIVAGAVILMKLRRKSHSSK